MFTFLSTPVDTVVITASRLRDNSIGGYCKRLYYDDSDSDSDYDRRESSPTFISTPEGITALCEGLKGSSVTSLECAAAPSVRFYVNAH